jgi:ATP-binding cassette subfamily B protein RaxB
MTRIVIAHRQETILSADIIYMLAEGKLTDVTSEYKASLNRVGEQ